MIHFWDNKKYDGREGFYKKIYTKYGINVSTDESDLTNDIKVIFRHDHLDSKFYIGRVIISYGGDSRKNENTFDNLLGTVSYLYFKIIEDNIASFYSKILDLDIIDAEHVHSCLFNNDKNLESLLLPFICISPFAGIEDVYNLDGKESKVADAYKAINEYLNK
jgi:hypothetical protein